MLKHSNNPVCDSPIDLTAKIPHEITIAYNIRVIYIQLKEQHKISQKASKI